MKIKVMWNDEIMIMIIIIIMKCKYRVINNDEIIKMIKRKWKYNNERKKWK